MMSQVVHAIRPLMDSIPPDITSKDPEERARMAAIGAYLADLPPRVLHDTVRLLTGSAADILEDYFETDIMQGWLASSGIIGSKVGPRSQGSGLVLLYHSFGEHDGAYGTWAFHKGGNGGFTQVLARAAQAFGAEIRLESPVERVITKDGRATGVALEDGTEFTAPVVVSALDPRNTFMQLVDPRELPTDLVEDIRRFKFQGTSSKVNFALDSNPTFPGSKADPITTGGSSTSGPASTTWKRPSTTPSTGGTARGPTSTAASSRTSTRTWPRRARRSCRASSSTPRTSFGRATGTPSGTTSVTSSRRLEELFPGFGDLVLHREVVTPLDIERTVGLTEGNIFAGEFLAPQMFFFRPAPGWNQYRTPIEGYYQCGSGTHPGGCVMGAPGRFASQQIIGDFGKKKRR
jgi:phytoene dehydrogenase-like protein